MKTATKVLIVLLCASVCTGGAMLSLKERGANEYRHKTKVVPINNRVKQRSVWIWS